PSDVQHQRGVDPSEDPLLVLDPEQDIFEVVEQLKDRIDPGAERARRGFEGGVGQKEPAPTRAYGATSRRKSIVKKHRSRTGFYQKSIVCRCFAIGMRRRSRTTHCASRSFTKEATSPRFSTS